MSQTIASVQHRHSDQRSGDPDLVLEVGKPLPRFYQIGRRPGRLVKNIRGRNPVICTLDDGDEIYIGDVRAITLASDA